MSIPTGVFGITNDSLNRIERIQRKSININPAFVIGNEQGLSGRIEYENNNWGKILFNSDLGFINTHKGGFIIDFGLGYGYPIIYSKNSSIYINGIATYLSNGLDVTELEGPTAIIEMELRKSWNEFSICLTPFYRRLYLYDLKYYPDNKSVLSDLHKFNCIGLRIGLTYNFSLLK